MFKRILWTCLILSLLVSTASSDLAWAAQTSAQNSPQIKILRSDENGLLLELRTADFEIVSETTPDGAFDRIDLPGADATAEAGKPQLPQVSALIGIPPDGTIQLKVLEIEIEEVPGSYNLIPAPSPVPPVEELQPGEWATIQDAAAYQADSPYPADPALIASEAWVRDQRIARITFSPFQYDPAQGSLQWNRRIRVEVSFLREAQAESVQPALARPAQESLFAPTLKSALLNYEVAKNWQGQPGSQAGLQAAPLAQAASLGPRYRIVVDQDGLYEIAYADLSGVMANIDTVDPRNFQFSSQGADVDIYVAGESDGSFDPGDKIVFYGQKFYGDRHAARYAAENTHWNTYNQQQTDGSFLQWKPDYNATMVEKYTDENVYWLIVGASPGSRMATVDGDPAGNPAAPEPYFRATIHAEENTRWKTDQYTTEDTWFWERVEGGTPPSFPAWDIDIKLYTTTLTSLATDPYSATIRAEVISDRFPTTQHHTYFYLNENLVDDNTWQGESLYTFEKQIPYSFLQPGDNVLRFDFDDIFYQYYFNWYEIDYNRLFEAQEDQLWFNQSATGTHKYLITNFTDTNGIFLLDVTTPLTPTRILNPLLGSSSATISVSNAGAAAYFAASQPAARTPKSIAFYQPPDLYAASNAADYVLITHADFVAAAQGLADYRASQGHTTLVIDAQDLYNEFNDGIYNPIAIKNFLAYALANWQTAPAYALLIGDGNWNFKSYFATAYGDPGTIYMPPSLAWVDPWQGEVDATNLLAAIVGDDPLADLHIARLPVSSAAEMNAYTAKVIAYESAAGSQPWQRRMLFVADNYDPKAGDFDATQENIINQHLGGTAYQADRLYQDVYGCTSAGSGACLQFTSNLITTINLTGTLIMSYHGHGANNSWSDEQIFDDADIAALNNASQLPIVLSMDCLDGYWFFPPNSYKHELSTSLAEELVTAANKGAIAVFAPSGLGIASGHGLLHQGFMEALFEQNTWELGPATLNGKLTLYNASYGLDLIQTFTIIGDPALQIPRSYGIFLPLVTK